MIRSQSSIALAFVALGVTACSGSVYYANGDASSQSSTSAPFDATYVDGNWVLPDGRTLDALPTSDTSSADSTLQGDSGPTDVGSIGDTTTTPADSSVDSGLFKDTGTDASIDSAVDSRFDLGFDIGADAVVTPPQAPTIGGDGHLQINAGKYVILGSIAASSGGSGTSISLSYDATSFCATGVVATNSTWQSWAQASFSVNQPSGGPASTLSLTANAITIAFSNTAKSPLRLQIADASYNYWCYELDAKSSPITIPLSSFNTKCWDNSGTPFKSGTPIQTMSLVVPGSNTSKTPFDFCFLGLAIN